jgi:hypothetical protein
MHTMFAVLFFLFGVFIAVWSAMLALERKKGRQLYAVPSCYCVLVGVVTALVAHERIDFAAIAFCSAAFTFIGWGTARFELRRR